MYAVAARLDPGLLLRARPGDVPRDGRGRASPCVGEFHYLHHGPDGTPYDDPNAMGARAVEAAREAGLRIALLDTCYLAAGFGAPPRGCAAPVQRRRRDALGGAGRRARAGRAGAADRRRDPLGPRRARATRCARRRRWADGTRAAARAPVRAGRRERRLPRGVRLHPDRGCSPSRRARPAHHRRARHPPHRRRHRAARRRRHRACFCPTTERDLGDGIGPARALHDAGRRAHARLRQPRRDRPVRGDARPSSSTSGWPPSERGHWSAAELLAAATAGHALARLRRRRPDRRRARAPTWSPSTPTSVRTAGTGADEDTAVFAATAADVATSSSTAGSSSPATTASRRRRRARRRDRPALGGAR